MNEETLVCPRCGEPVAEYSEYEDDGTGVLNEVLVYECSDRIDYTDNWSSEENTCGWKGYCPITLKEFQNRKELL